VQLLPGDVIYVPPVGNLVALAGSVNVPGIFELKEHETLDDVLKYAGGITTTANGCLLIALTNTITAGRLSSLWTQPVSKLRCAMGISSASFIYRRGLTMQSRCAATLLSPDATPGARACA